MKTIVLLTSLIHLAAAVYLFWHKPHTRAKVAFALCAFQLSAWSFAHYFGQFYFEGMLRELTMAGRFSLISVLFFPSTFALFCSYLVDSSNKVFHKLALFSFIFPLAMLPFSFGTLNADGFYLGQIKYDFLITGPVYNVYIPYLLGVFLVSYAYLFYSFFKVQTLARKHHIGLFLSLSILPFFIGAMNNAAIPKWFGIYTKPEIGTIVSIFFTLAVVYIVARYRFMDVHVALKKRTALLFVVGVLIASAIISYLFLRTITQYYYLLLVVIILILPLAFLKLLQGIDSIFFLDKLHMQKNLSRESKRISSMKDITAFYDYTLRIVSDRSDYKVVDLFILQRQYARLHNYFSRSPFGQNIYFKSISMYYMSRVSSNILSSDAVTTMPGLAGFCLRHFFRSRHIDAVVKFKKNGELLGIALLIRKGHPMRYDPAGEGQVMSDLPTEVIDEISQQLYGVNMLYESFIGAQRHLNEREYTG